LGDLLEFLVNSEKVMFMAIALALVAIAVFVFARGIHDLVVAPPREEFAVTVTRGANSVLFIVVVLELVRTIVARLEGGGWRPGLNYVVGGYSTAGPAAYSARGWPACGHLS
jgi:uncharacterized membrane protein (DUF373 family)